MNVTRHKAAARGVSQLMYVGDDQAVESATPRWSWPTIAVVAVLGWLLYRGAR